MSTVSRPLWLETITVQVGAAQNAHWAGAGEVLKLSKATGPFTADWECCSTHYALAC